MSHEQSETIQLPSGKWVNVYGRRLPKAGQQLPGTPEYDTVEAAVSAAKNRSAAHGSGGGYDYAADLLSPKAATEPAKAPEKPHNYADDLLRPRTQGFSQAVAQQAEQVGKAASFGALTKAAMVDDQQTKFRIYAEDLFPGDKGAIERFGMHNGEVVYVGKDDKLYKAEPSGGLGGPKSFAANTVGNLPTIAGATAGALVGAPAGPFTAAGLGALGAAGGKGIQEIIASLALGEPQTTTGNALNMAKEAAFAGGGGLGGAIFQKWAQRNLVRDVAKLDPAKVAELDAKAANIGVDLNVAQRTNVPSIKGRAEALARIPASADDMNASLERTRQQAGTAADEFVAGVSPVQSVREAGEQGRSGANAILERIASDRSTAAKPHYDRAFQATVDSRDENLQRLMDTDAFKKGYERAVRIAKNEGIDLGNEANNMRVLHYVKMGIDDLLDPKGAAKEGIGATEQRSIMSVKNRLLKVMDTASPDYARARSIYGHYMPTLKAHREGTLGALADLADEDLSKASKMVFNPQNSPEDVRKLRSLFFRFDQGEQWKALTKGYLEDTLEQSSRQFKSGPGAGKAVTWRYMMMGDLKQAANLRAAMTEEQWKGFGNMMDVFEAVGRVQGTGNSITMPMQEQAKQLGREAGSTLANLVKPRQAIIEWLEDARLGKHATEMVKVLNDPDGIKKLNALRSLSPNDKRFVQGFSTLFGVEASPE